MNVDCRGEVMLGVDSGTAKQRLMASRQGEVMAGGELNEEEV